MDHRVGTDAWAGLVRCAGVKGVTGWSGWRVFRGFRCFWFVRAGESLSGRVLVGVVEPAKFVRIAFFSGVVGPVDLLRIGFLAGAGRRRSCTKGFCPWWRGR